MGWLNMTIETLIRTALTEVWDIAKEEDEMNLRPFFIQRHDLDLPCMAYNYTSRPAYFADNSCKSDYYIVTVNLLINKGVEKYKRLVVKHMEKHGFVRTLTSATYLEDSGYFNTPIQFLISLRKEDEYNE